MALGPIGMSWSRYQVVEFATPIVHSVQTFIYRTSDVLEPDFLVFSKMFQNNVSIVNLSQL